MDERKPYEPPVIVGSMTLEENVVQRLLEPPPSEVPPKDSSPLDGMYAGISVYEGKYRFYLKPDDYRVFVQRYGEDWFVFDKGGRAVLALMQEIEELRQQVKELRSF